MSYKTVRCEATGSVTLVKSEFIAKVAPVSTTEEAADFINSVRAEHPRAKHHCYAYTLREGFETRFSDDGEPQGTAGPLILDVIQKNSLVDVCIVVTRYFGGVLLGRGGLKRAYSSSSAIAVAAAPFRIMSSARELRISMEYSYYDIVLRLLPKYEIKTIDQSFGSGVELKLWCREELCESFLRNLTEMSNGRIRAEQSEIFYADFA